MPHVKLRLSKQALAELERRAQRRGLSPQAHAEKLLGQALGAPDDPAERQLSHLDQALTQLKGQTDEFSRSRTTSPYSDSERTQGFDEQGVSGYGLLD